MEQILPGVSIEVRPEGLIIPGVVSISAIGMVGTASKGPIGDPILIGSPAEAREVFGDPDAFVTGSSNELTLVRALDLAYDHGARDVIAVRVGTGAVSAAFSVTSPTGECCVLTAATPGSWANALEINIADAEEASLVVREAHAGGAPITLDHTTVLESVRNVVSVVASGSSTPILPVVVHDTGGPVAGQVDIATATGNVTFPAGEEPAGDAQVFVTYAVPLAQSRKVTLRHAGLQEVFTVGSGGHLVRLVNDEINPSDLVTGANGANSNEAPDTFAINEFRKFGTGGAASGTNGGIFADDGATAVAYETGLDALSNEPAFIIVAAGQGHELLGANLTAHVEAASSDENKRERIGVIGSGRGETLDDTLEHTLASDRVILVAPGIQVNDPVSGQRVTLPGGYAAAAVAGMISGAPVNRSLTNKVLAVAGLEEEYTQAELRRLVLARVLALEKKLGFRTVKGITTSTNTAWHQITTRRIVDKAKFGVRSAANPYIGLLNNERVRAAMRSTINSFLTEMVVDEELVSYELEVTATRDDERRGIARVTMVLRPTFSIDFIKVTMFLE